MTSAVPVITRGAESAGVERFFDALSEGSRCLLLEGEVGIGKTTVLTWARASASGRGYRVLSANPVEIEVPWEFAALADLLEAVPRAVIRELPEPQRLALGVAVFRDESSEEPVDPRTLATAVLKVLRRLAEEAPVLLAIDDLPWLDLPSARVLSYVLRRANDAPVGLLGTVRVEWSKEPVPLVTDSVEPSQVEHVNVGALSLEAMGALLAARTGRRLGRNGLARVHELSRGNPLFALELVEENATGLAADPGRSVSVPESLRGLVRRRVTPLTAGARNVLLVAALSGEPSQSVVVSAATAGRQGASQDLQRVVDAGIVQRSGDGLAFAHPLIRSVVADDATPAQRRAAHRRLASAVRHREVRARHLALGAEGPDEAVASDVEEATVSAEARGACETAAILAGLAASLTPPDRVDDRRRRITMEAENRFQASEPVRACELLEGVIAEMPPGPARAELLRRLARYLTYRGDPFELWMTRLIEALDESGDDLELRAAIAFDLGTAAANASGQGAVVDEYGLLALSLAEQAGAAALEAQICAGMAFYAFLNGEGVRHDLVARGLSGPEQPTRLSMELRPRVAIGHLLHLSGDLDGARALYEQEYERALGEGVETTLPLLLWGLIETEAWAGNWDRAEELGLVGSELADDESSPVGLTLMAVTGLLSVYRGRIDEGMRQAELAVAAAMKIGFPTAALIAAQAIGLAALSVGDAVAAHERLGPIMEVVRAMGIPEPGFFHFVPDEIEALIRLGDLEAAHDLLSVFKTRSDEVGRVWGIAASGRCRGLLLAAQGDLDAASVAVDRALDVHARLPMPFEHGRTLLVAGEIARRARHKRRAQEALERAATIFAELGAPLWEQRAREELGRVGLRAPQRSAAAARELTEAERRVAELVADGQTNAEVASKLFMSRRTVEAHLTKIYRKLGVRSRTQLSRVHRPPAP